MSHATAAIVLAAGRGTRMRSRLPKVLHPVLGRPMIARIVGAALAAGFDRVVVVVGYGGDEVERALTAAFPDAPLAFARQHEQRGTGHAVLCGLDATAGCDAVAVLSGDTPALSADTLAGLRAVGAATGAALVVSTFSPVDPTGYGRVVRAGGDGDRVSRIVEHADASEAERAIGEVNAGLYLADRAALADALAHLTPHNAQGELYLTDVVAHVAAAGRSVAPWPLMDPLQVAGVNTRVQLADIEAQLLARRRVALMEAGVTLVDPATTRVEDDVIVGEDTVLGAGAQLLGRTRVGRGCRVDAGAVLTDCDLGDGVHVKAYVVATEAVLHDAVAVGPFAHLRPGTELGVAAKVGNFVETKKARLGPGSKASHLSYLGDCELGRDVNVGAGTITCNYDGFAKHRTVIGDGVFIGSDTQLVAPVRVGDNAVIGAGTTVTRDVPDGALAVSRAPQREIAGYYERRRKPLEEARAAARAKTTAPGGAKGDA